MKGEFIIMINGELITYKNYDDIPDKFDHVIKFLPDWPPGDPETGHTEEEHQFMATFNNKLQKLMEIERAGGN